MISVYMCALFFIYVLNIFMNDCVKKEFFGLGLKVYAALSQCKSTKIKGREAIKRGG